MKLPLEGLTMEILINPNVAYLILVVGIMLTMMALFAPGTGILEVSALFTLLLAGWEMTQLPINLWALIVLVVGVVPFIIAVRRSHNLAFLVVALIAFVIGSAYLFQGEKPLQPGVNLILAIVVSVLASGFIWLATTKVLESEKLKPQHDLADLIGEEGEARTDILDEGSVQIGSELWSARSNAKIYAGSKVKVLKRDGFILEVEASPGQEETAQ
jgi:membrane-bound serine protease (ClpP class)